MTETVIAPSAVRSRLALGALALFAALAVLVYGYLHAYGFLHDYNTGHASTAYLALLYLAVLPLLLLYSWANRNQGNAQLRLPRYEILAFVAVAVLITSAFLTRNCHFIADEYAYGFQARIFASGHLKAEPMPGAVADPLETPKQINFAHNIQSPTGWFTKYPPLWPLILAGGYLLHCPWLLNPLFGALQLLLTWHLAKPWGRNTQALAILMTATSPYLLSLDFGLLSHASNAAFSLLALAAVLKGVREQKFGWIAVSLLLVVASTQIRPYTGAVLGLYCAFIVGWEFRRSPKLLVRGAVLFAAAGILAAGLLLYVNWLFTGNPLLSPYALSNGGQIRELTFNPLKIVGNLLHTWRWTITDTIRAAFPFVFVAAMYALWRERVRRMELIYLSLLFPLLILAYLLNSMGATGNIAGERFYFEGFCAISIVGARGFELLFERWNVARTSAVIGVGVLTALQLAMIVFTVQDVMTSMRPYQEAYVLAHQPSTPPLVFLIGDGPPFTAMHVNWNDADWQRARTIFVVDPAWTDKIPSNMVTANTVACQIGRRDYRVIGYDPRSEHMEVEDHRASCTGRF